MNEVFLLLLPLRKINYEKNKGQRHVGSKGEGLSVCV